MIPAQYQDLPAAKLPMITQEGVKIKVISGEQAGKKSATKNVVPVLSLEGWIDTDHSYQVQIPSGYRTFLYLIQGRGKFGRNKKETTSGHVIWLAPHHRNGTFAIEAINSLHFFMCSGPPIKAPVIAQGPFVMNTMDEIRQAYRDYQLGKFGGPITTGKK
jgi:redox-sensitive bicupin YhaK (pirin superfamily)